jgi:hypothetical protein
LLSVLTIGNPCVKANSARHLRRRASAEVGTVKGQEDVGLTSTAPYKLIFSMDELAESQRTVSFNAALPPCLLKTFRYAIGLRGCCWKEADNTMVQ